MISVKPLFVFMAYHNISIKELSNKSGVAYSTLIKIKKTGNFTFSVIDKICSCLNVEIKDVIRYEED